MDEEIHTGTKRNMHTHTHTHTHGTEASIKEGGGGQREISRKRMAILGTMDPLSKEYFNM